MAFLQSPQFWFAALAILIINNLDLGLKNSTRFGLLNAAALVLLLGSRNFIILITFVATCWILLYGLKKISALASAKAVASFSGLFCFAIASLFILHKLNLDNHDVLERLLTNLGLYSAGTAPALQFLALISFSYVFLRISDVFIASGLGKSALLNPIGLLGYLTPFHMLASGPIAAYSEHLKMDTGNREDLKFTDLLNGLNTITGGLFYKFVLAQGIKMFVFGVDGSITVPENLTESIFLFIYVFFDFAGYSKIALGIGQLIKVPTPVNFDAPLLSYSITDFWKRWHMSLGSFVNRNIYTPTQLALVRRFGMAKAHWITAMTLMLSFIFVGIWHRLTLSFMIWGGVMGLIIFLEKVIRDYFLRRQLRSKIILDVFLRVLGPAYVILVLSLSLLLVWKDML